MNRSIKPAVAPKSDKKIFGLNKSELKLVAGGGGVIVEKPVPPLPPPSNP
jgi:hypothetical protein